MRIVRILAWSLLATLPVIGGCAITGLASVMAESFESQKLIEVHPRYDGLKNKSIAVVVNTDLSLLYEHPGLVQTVTTQVSGALQYRVEGARVVPAQAVLAWQYSTPHWAAMTYGDLAEQMGVDRIVYIDIHEYRLHPLGNSWMWDGLATAEVGVIERDGIDPDSFADVFPVRVSFPDTPGIGRESATAQQVETGLLTKFIRRTAWLFYFHTEPKYPDKYQQGIDDGGEYFNEVGSR